MPLLLNIDTATEFASVCISDDYKPIAIEKNADQKSHASFIQPAIKEILEKIGISLNEIDAIGVSAGPGSYTGLRVGLSTAKGLCYALNKPLILVSTLEVMAIGTINDSMLSNKETLLHCPMIDARRMEVFSAVYDINRCPVMSPQSMVLDENSFEKILKNNKIIFSGNGNNKFRNIISNANALFSRQNYEARHLAMLTAEKFHKKDFGNLAYSEPFYLKEFYSKTGTL